MFYHYNGSISTKGQFGLTPTEMLDVQRANYRVFWLLDNKDKAQKYTKYEMLS